MPFVPALGAHAARSVAAGGGETCARRRFRTGVGRWHFVFELPETAHRGRGGGVGPFDADARGRGKPREWPRIWRRFG